MTQLAEQADRIGPGFEKGYYGKRVQGERGDENTGAMADNVIMMKILFGIALVKFY